MKNIIKKTKTYDGKYDLFIDEIDHIDYGQRTVVINKGKKIVFMHNEHKFILDANETGYIHNF